MMLFMTLATRISYSTWIKSPRSSVRVREIDIYLISSIIVGHVTSWQRLLLSISSARKSESHKLEMSYFNNDKDYVAQFDVPSFIRSFIHSFIHSFISKSVSQSVRQSVSQSVSQSFYRQIALTCWFVIYMYSIWNDKLILFSRHQDNLRNHS